MPDADSPTQAAATATPHYPSFVDSAPKSGEGKCNGIQFNVYSFPFLGIEFATGVNSLLADKLIAAQRNLYNLCLSQKGVTSVSEEEFGLWCWYGQVPVGSTAANLKQVQHHIGMRGGGYHSSGSAVDINVGACPFIAGRTNKVTYGETHDTFPDDVVAQLAGLSPTELQQYRDSRKKVPDGQTKPKLPGDLKQRIWNAEVGFWRKNVWDPAVQIYDRAMQLMYNQDADVSDAATSSTRFNKTSDNPPVYVHYDRFVRVSLSLTYYFGLVYQRQSGGHQTLDYETFAGGFQALVDGGAFNPNAKDLDGQPLNVTIATNRDGVCRRYYDQIQADHEMIKRVFVKGHLQVDANQNVTVPAFRDPCDGFLNIRPEVVTELVCEQHLRWGCCLFGAGPDANGDVMHFDLGGDFGIFPFDASKVPATLNRQPGT